MFNCDIKKQQQKNKVRINSNSKILIKEIPNQLSNNHTYTSKLLFVI